MAAAGLVLTTALLSGLWGNLFTQTLLVVLYGGLCFIYRRFWLIVLLLVGLLWGNWKHSWEKPIPQKGYVEMEITITSHPTLTPDGTYRYQAGKIFFTWGEVFHLGDRVFCRGHIRPYGTQALFLPREIVVKKRSFLLGWLSELSLLWQTSIVQNVPERHIQALLFALVLGNRTYLDYTTKREFQISGLFHLLAISGLHLALITGVLNICFALFLPKKYALMISCLLATFYTMLLGFPASLLRACLFLWGYALLWEVRPQILWLNYVALSAAVCCLLLPPSWLGIGFSLSFLAVMGIILLARPFAILFQKFTPFDTILGTTFAANLATFPLISWSIGEISVISPLANLFILPLFPFLLAGCFVSALWALFSPIPFILLSFLDHIWHAIAFVIHGLSFAEVLSFRLSSSITALFYGLMGFYLLWKLLSVPLSKKKKARKILFSPKNSPQKS
ncbi:ComEC/Rec2 family competence protein [Thermospira aquatica]|uniref:ComEC/Rec2 family competence protein n=1 Tax=Thermospira aquatica TaxID=2828656 RepID=A0AAX3BAP5_9SPIR|nr:ComEC/Rec2 family competence protein [Thermospira aquatica]URA09323.1 ComEC/Rec2 family competence protein [Thermospira aquatica]